MNFKKLLLFGYLTLVFTACNQDAKNYSYEEEIKNLILSGKVIDGYIDGAKVCIDLNRNGKCDSNEPSATSRDDGSFDLSYSKDIDPKDLVLIAFGGVDISTNKSFTGFLAHKLENSNSANLTPISTLITSLEDSNTSKAEAMKKVAKIFNIKEANIFKDPIELANNKNLKLLKANLEAESVIEFYKKDTKDVQKSIKEFASKLDNSDSLEEAISKLNSNTDKLQELLIEIKKIDTSRAKEFFSKVKLLKEKIKF